MAIKVSQKDWKNEDFRIATLSIAEMLGESVEVEMLKQKLKPYNAQIWANDDIVFEKDFNTKYDALKWIKARLKNESNAYADLKKYSSNRDDFEWWFYKLKNKKLIDVTDRGDIEL